MTRVLRRFIVVLTIAVALILPTATGAWADLDSSPTANVVGTTLTNPNPPFDDATYADYWWRQGWGNSLTPQMALNPPESMITSEDGLIIGMLYTIDKTSGTPIISSNPENYDFSSYGATTNNLGPYGTNPDGSFDLLAIANGLHLPVDGMWYLHYMFMSTKRASATTLQARFKIDLTAPSQVSSVTVATSSPSGSAVATQGGSTWTESSRAVVRWAAEEQDALSGVAYYQVLVDGQPFVPLKDSSPELGRVYSPLPGLGIHPSSLTIENMPPGRHKISVIAVDRATNESAESTAVYFQSDPDTPKISLTSPSGSMIGAHPSVVASASDDAGVALVEFKLDDGHGARSLLKRSSTPYSGQVDLSSFASGPCTLTATVTDRYGRTATDLRASRWTRRLWCSRL